MQTLTGIGVGARREFVDDLVQTQRAIDWIEIVPENWIGRGGRTARLLAQLAERWTVVPHSTSLSIGGPDPIDDEFVGDVDRLCRDVGSPFWSDHIAYARLGGVYAETLLPLPLSPEAIDHTVSRIRTVRQRTSVPLAFENPTVYAHMAGGSMEEVDFVRAIVEGADTGMVLDVNNVHVNAVNHGFDPYRYLDRVPYERVWQIHLAGHRQIGRTIIDTHEGPIIDAVWALYRHALQRAGRLIPTLIEWDTNVPPLDKVADEADRARAHAQAALSGLDARGRAA